MTDDLGKESSISDLPLHDQLLHGIGRVAQAQVVLEMVLRQIFVSLTAGSPALYLLSKRGGIDQIAQDCRVLVVHSALPDEIRDAGGEALKAAIEADKLRHRVVHDWWRGLLDADDPDGAPFRRLRPMKSQPVGYHSEPSDLAYVNDAEAELHRHASASVGSPGLCLN